MLLEAYRPLQLPRVPVDLLEKLRHRRINQSPRPTQRSHPFVSIGVMSTGDSVGHR